MQIAKKQERVLKTRSVFEWCVFVPKLLVSKKLGVGGCEEGGVGERSMASNNPGTRGGAVWAGGISRWG
jgi:hypothetical protein